MIDMIDMITPKKLNDPFINDDADHLADAIRYCLRKSRADHLDSILKHAYRPAEQRSYACECRHCEITLYTSTKRLNCEYCGSSDPEVFTCTELEE